MFVEIAKTFLEFMKLAPRFLVALGLAAGMMLFANDQLLKRLGLSDLVVKYRSVLGLTLVLSVALVVTSIARFLLGSIKNWWRQRRFQKQMIERLQDLTEDEKQILRYYIANNTRANRLSIQDGVVQGLVAKGIIYQSAAMGNLLEGFDHNINEVAWNYLHSHPGLLDGSTDFCRTDKREGHY
jgi:hypothetical protein